MRIENAFLHLLLVGLAQGFYKLAFSRDGVAEWELSANGDLAVEVSPA